MRLVICDHIALGLQGADGNPMALDAFGMERGATTYHDWPGNGAWYKKFQAYLAEGSTTRMSFNLDGITDPVASAKAGRTVDSSGFEGLTNWGALSDQSVVARLGQDHLVPRRCGG